MDLSFPGHSLPLHLHLRPEHFRLFHRGRPGGLNGRKVHRVRGFPTAGKRCAKCRGESNNIKRGEIRTFQESSIGLYFPSIGCLRSEYVPESHRATVRLRISTSINAKFIFVPFFQVTNWYRVPMNLMTCLTLLAVNHPRVAEDKRAVFAACTGLLVRGKARKYL